MTATVVRLEEKHRTELHASGIPDDLIEEAGIRLISDHDAYELGFRTSGGSLCGMLFPYWDIEVAAFSDRFYRLKPDKRIDGRKYLQLTWETNRFYLLPGTTRDQLQDVARPVLILEGEKKTLCAEACRRRRGDPHLPIGISGARSWLRKVKGLLPDGSTGRVGSVPIPDFDLINWRGRKVILGLDGDVDTNPAIMWSECDLAKEFLRRGAGVYAIRIPPGKDGARRGADDFIIQEGDDAWAKLLDAAVAHEGRPVGSGRESVYCHGDGIFRIGGAGYEKLKEKEWVAVTDFVVRIEEEIVPADPSDQKILRGHLLAAGRPPLPIQLTASDLADARRFREVLYGASVGLNYPPKLSGLVPMLAQRLGHPPVRRSGTRCVGRHENQFVFPSTIIRAGMVLENTDCEILNTDEHVRRYDLPQVPLGILKDVASVIMDDILPLHSPRVILPIVGCVGLAPVQHVFRAPGFTVYLGGDTDAGKTLVARVAVNFYADYSLGEGLPSVTSTVNALEFTGHHLPGLLYVIDDLKRQWLEKHQTEVIRLLQGNYDRHGRGRMDRLATRKQTEYYIRAILILTGEDFPQAIASSTERTLQIIVPKDELARDFLERVTRIDARRHDLRGLTAHYFAWLQRQQAAGTLRPWDDSGFIPPDRRLRPYCIQILTGLQLLFRFLEEECGVDESRLNNLFLTAIDGLAAIAVDTRHEADDQRDHQVFIETLKQLLSSGACRLNEAPPNKPRSDGVVIGEVKDEMVCILPDVAIAEVRKTRGVSLNVASLGRALKNRGLLARLGEDSRPQFKVRLGGPSTRVFAFRREVFFPTEDA